MHRNIHSKTSHNNFICWKITISTTGAVSSRHDFQPFGEELFVAGGRTAQQGYSSATDNLRQKFIGKERDAESGLDFFGARYYGPTLGRFTSIDPIKLTVARLYDPQRTNLYGYCRNSPLKYLDPDGKDLVLANATAQAQARANIDANLRQNERANIRIEGNRVLVNDAKAVNLATASSGYRYLSQIIGSSTTFNYFGVSEGQPVMNSNGDQLAWDDVRAGATQFTSSGIVDVFVPVGGAPDSLGTNGEFIPFPEDLVFGHELFGHALCGPGQCAVDVENELREERGLVTRSGEDHESLPGERAGNMGSTSQNVTVTDLGGPVETTAMPVLEIEPKMRSTIPLLPLDPNR